MNEKRCKKNYGFLGLMPIIVFFVAWVGVGVVFALMGVEGPFNIMSRYTALLFALVTGLVIMDREETIEQKADVYYENAGRKGPMQLGLIILMAGGFADCGRDG
ncbi:MAG: hypothetical protein LUC99_09830 [Clostridiales bacterium]|nr:hypothetical protein [Clostridiales bacterium]